jgi:hypothetical protein
LFDPLQAYFAKLKRREKPNQPSFNNDNNNFDNQQQEQAQSKSHIVLFCIQLV